MKAPIIVEVRGGVVVAVYGPSDQGYCLIDWDDIREPDPVHGKWDREQEGALVPCDNYRDTPFDTAMNCSHFALQVIGELHPECLRMISLSKNNGGSKNEPAKQP